MSASNSPAALSLTPSSAAHTASVPLSDTLRERFAREVAKYPADQAQSAVMACLAMLQKEEGYVSVHSETLVAEYLGMPQIAVHEVMTFYNMYNQRPVGRYKLNVCTNLPCQLQGGVVALAHLEKKLGVQMGHTTKDGMFTLQQSECLGACADAPVMLVNDRTMCSFMSNDKLDQLIDGLSGAARGGAMGEKTGAAS
ncbi:MAG: NAD(P)H-dependent oxidoreductase subunit E [Variovorax sp.]